MLFVWYSCIFLSKKLVCLWSMCIHTPMRSPFKSWNMRLNIMTTFFLVSSYPINDWKLWLICFNETSIMNCSLINHNNPVLRALPFIQATAEVILHNYSKFPVFERGLWKRPILISVEHKGEVLMNVLILWTGSTDSFKRVNSNARFIHEQDIAASKDSKDY